MQNSASNNLSEQILNQSLWRIMLRLSVPGILGMLAVSLNTFIDAIFVGQLIGKNALAAISLALPLTLVVAGLSSLVGVGASSLLSRAIGAKDVTTQGKIFGNTLVMSLVISSFLTVFGYWFAQDLIAFMGGKGEVLTLGATYLEIFMLGSFFRVFGVAGNMLIRAEGKIREAMTFTTISMILNIGLNPLFISGLGWGIAGSAWASVSALAVYSVLNIAYFASNRPSFPVNLTRFRLDIDLMPKILPVGISAMLMQVLFFLQQTIVFKSIAVYGTEDDLAFMGAYYRVIMLAVVPVFGFVQSLQPVVGISYGAKNYSRVVRAVQVFSWGGTLLLTLIWLPIQLFPQVVLHWMLPQETFSANDLSNFRLAILMLPTMPFMFIGITLFQAIGNGRLATTLLMVRQVILFIPVVLILPVYWGVSGIFYASPVVDTVVLAVTSSLVWREFGRLLAKESPKPVVY
ncbi:MAG: MATE family efflux transporter [Microscillaceae bacterium]|jgi:putative MATE family efflux protein|nr:MATE family efflux transporter [Microscillaceae bacterium]